MKLLRFLLKRGSFPVIAILTLWAAFSNRTFAAAADEVSPTLTVAATEITGKRTTGQLVEITPTAVTLAGDPPVVISTDQIVRLERVEKPKDAWPIDSSPVLFLANGDRIAARAKSIAGEAMNADWVRFSKWPPLTIPLETLAGAIIAPWEAGLPRDRMERRLETRTESNDLIELSRGDQLTGELQDWAGKSLTLRTAAGNVSIEASKIQALALDRSLTSFPKIEGRRQLLQLVDGSQITVQNLKFNGGQATAQAAFGTPLTFPGSAIAECRFLGGSLVALSEMTPSTSRHVPFISGEWKTALNRSVEGRPLRMRKSLFPRGLGVHSRSELSYDLGAKSVRFFAVAGIDDEASGKGSVVFAVEVDGKRVFTSEPQTGSDPAITIGPIDLNGAKSLTLIVDFGPMADIQDHADWCDAVLQFAP